METLRIEVIDRVYAAVLAEKTPVERIAMAGAAHRTRDWTNRVRESLFTGWERVHDLFAALDGI